MAGDRYMTALFAGDLVTTPRKPVVIRKLDGRWAFDVIAAPPGRPRSRSTGDRATWQACLAEALDDLRWMSS